MGQIVDNEEEADEENVEEDKDDKNEGVIGIMRRVMLKRMMIALNIMIKHSYRYNFDYELLLTKSL